MNPEIEKVLTRVQKPARYVGGEWNAVRKDWAQTPVKIAFAFPDVYEVGMSHLGLQILYHVVNQRDDALMERTFAPWVDMEKEMRRHGIPLFTLESHRPIKDFDLLAFTLQYELTFTNVLNMLDLAGLPLRSAERSARHPLVIAGGPCAYNPEPLAEFIDLFVIGEGEEVFHEIIDLIKDFRLDGNREKLFLRAAGISGVYVPSLYLVEYKPDGRIKSLEPLREGVPEQVTKRVVKNFEASPFPAALIVPSTETVHDRVMLEVMRGCTRGCRFCQAGVIYRPVREKSPEKLLAQARELVKHTGYDEISLVSLSTADYSRVEKLVRELLDEFASQKINISLPSLRVDAFSVDLAREVSRVRKAGLTFAPEAGTQRLRDVINKGVTEEDLLHAVESAFTAGWAAVKMYFMIGLPTETRADVEGIARLAHRVLETGRRLGVPRGRLAVTVSVSCFVPKPHTPFQWEAQDTLESLNEKQAVLKDLLRTRGIVFRWHDPEMSFLEAVLARGDRRLGAALEEAWRMGCRFDGWSESFRFALWREAFARTGVDPDWYAHRRYSYDDILPWEHIFAGVSKKYLVREHERALEGIPTPDCRGGRCSGCGLCVALEIEPELSGGKKIAQIQGSV
ncbi:MAG: TIGR03960 family B12-binding radical SAM protein [Bacillota bacterium]